LSFELGYREHGSINTPLGLAIDNQTDRFNLTIDVIDRVVGLKTVGAHARECLKNQILDNQEYGFDRGIDKPEVRGWKWPY
jgi:xylulose-5-phosphate/fructose-6-phosphate phosphoketolase